MLIRWEGRQNRQKRQTEAQRLSGAQWLSLGSPKLRSTVAWAVWDAASPFSALTYLINESINDPNDSVRLYSLKALIQYQGDRIMRRSGIEKFLHDSCDTIREHATSVLKELDPDSE